MENSNQINMENMKLDEIDRLISKRTWERFQIEMEILEYQRRNRDLEHRIKMLLLQLCDGSLDSNPNLMRTQIIENDPVNLEPIQQDAENIKPENSRKRVKTNKVDILTLPLRKKLKKVQFKESPISPEKQFPPVEIEEVEQLSQTFNKLSPNPTINSSFTLLLSPTVPTVNNPLKSNSGLFLLNDSDHRFHQTSPDSDDDDDFFITSEDHSFDFFQEADSFEQFFSM